MCVADSPIILSLLFYNIDSLKSWSIQEAMSLVILFQLTGISFLTLSTL